MLLLSGIVETGKKTSNIKNLSGSLHRSMEQMLLLVSIRWMVVIFRPSG
jgi:hypothetical protein